MKKIYASIFIVILVTSVALAGESAPKIKIVSNDVDIGETQKGKISDFKIEVKNTGTSDLIIENVYPNCGCLEVTDPRWTSFKFGEYVALSSQNIVPEPVNIKPDKSIFIDARLNTNKITGVFEKQLHIVSNDPETKYAAWKVKGVVLDSASAVRFPDRSNNIGITADSMQDPLKSPDAKNIILFYSPGCSECIEIKDKFLPGLKEKYGNKIWVEEYNIDNPQAFAILLDMQNKYDKKVKKGFFNPRPPAVFAEGRLLYGVKDIKKKLEGLLSLKAN